MEALQPFSIKKIITALVLGYSAALAWVVYADVVFHNNVPLEDFTFHGLYPISLGLAAIITALIFDKSLKNFGFKKFKISYLVLVVLIALATLLIPFGLNLITSTMRINVNPKVDMELMQIGLPVLIILSMGEEVMWRGLLFSEFSKKYNFAQTSLIIGILWVLWHYPVIIHTKFIYGNLPLWFALISFTCVVISQSFIYNYLRTISKSLWPCILLHAFQNYVAFVVIEPFEQSITHTSIYFKSDIGIFYVLTLMVGAFWAYRKMQKNNINLKINKFQNGYKCI